jgi:anti-anti-sigma factor
MDRIRGFKLETTAVVDELHSIRLIGEVDFGCIEALAQSLYLLSGTSVEIEVSDLTFIDCVSVRVLIDVKEVFQSRGFDLYVTGAHGIVRRVFELVAPGVWLGE